MCRNLLDDKQVLLLSPLSPEAGNLLPKAELKGKKLSKLSKHYVFCPYFSNQTVYFTHVTETKQNINHVAL